MGSCAGIPHRRWLRSLVCAATLWVTVLWVSATPAVADLLLTNSAGQIRRFDQSSGACLGTINPPVITESVMGLAVGPDGAVYGTTNDVGIGGVCRYTGPSPGWVINEYGSSTRHGYTIPYGMAFGPGGNIYVTSNVSTNLANSAEGVLRYSAGGTYLGQFVSSTGLGNQVYDVAFGPGGDLLISDGTIRRYSAVTGAFLGTFVADGGGAITFGPDGNLYVADAGYSGNGVRRFNGATGAFIDTFVAPGSGGLSGPSDLAFGPDGNLYVVSFGADSRTRSVLRYDGASGAFLDTFVAPNAVGFLTGSGGSIVFTNVPEPMPMLPLMVAAAAATLRLPHSRAEEGRAVVMA